MPDLKPIREEWTGRPGKIVARMLTVEEHAKEGLHMPKNQEGTSVSGGVSEGEVYDSVRIVSARTSRTDQDASSR